MLVLYYSAADEIAWTDYLGNVSCVTLTGLPTSWPSGAAYQWWLRAYQDDDPDATPYNFGSSCGDREMTIWFTAEAINTDGTTLRKPGRGWLSVEPER